MSLRLFLVVLVACSVLPFFSGASASDVVQFRQFFGKKCAGAPSGGVLNVSLDTCFYTASKLFVYFRCEANRLVLDNRGNTTCNLTAVALAKPVENDCAPIGHVNGPASTEVSISYGIVTDPCAPTPVPTPDDSLRCTKKVDLVWLLDGSGSIHKEFPSELDLGLRVTERILIGPNSARVGIVQFRGPDAKNSAKNPAVRVELPITGDDLVVRKAFQGIKQLEDGWTRTDLAVEQAATMLTNAAAVRPEAKGVIIIVTDGLPEDGYAKPPCTQSLSCTKLQYKTVMQTALARMSGRAVFAIGVGPYVQYSRLLQYTNNASYVFTIDKLASGAELDKLIDRLSDAVCNVPKRRLPGSSPPSRVDPLPGGPVTVPTGPATPEQGPGGSCPNCTDGYICCGGKCVSGSAKLNDYCCSTGSLSYSCRAGKSTCCGTSCCPLGQECCAGLPFQQCCAVGQRCMGGKCIAKETPRAR